MIFVKAERGPGRTVLEKGVWRVELDPIEIKDGRFDAWIEREVRECKRRLASIRQS